jgi:hypothetical protein
MWDQIRNVSSGVTLVAFIIAAGVFAYRSWLQQRERLIKSTAERDRGPIVEQTLEFFAVDTSGLTTKQRYELALEQIKSRERRYLVTAIVIVCLALVAALVVVVALVMEKLQTVKFEQNSSPRPALVSPTPTPMLAPASPTPTLAPAPTTQVTRPASTGPTPIQSGPETGLIHADQFSVSSEGGDGSEKKEDRFVALPVGVKVDTSYHQPQINAVTGGGRTSPISVSNIPAGFYIKCHGDDTKGRGWSIQPPYDGSPILSEKNGQQIFKLGIYADTGHPGIYGGCTVVVDVFYKPAK